MSASTCVASCGLGQGLTCLDSHIASLLDDLFMLFAAASPVQARNRCSARDQEVPKVNRTSY